MRSLKTNVFVNNFSKLQTKQCFAALKSVCFKEKVKLDNATMTAIIEGANCDMRQILNNLAMWSANNKELTYDGVKGDIKDTKKHIKQNPFQFAREFFQTGFHAKPLASRIDTYFHDYSAAPLFVQEMYTKSRTGRANQAVPPAVEAMDKLSDAAESIAQGDLVHSRIYSSQAFGLLPIHAVASCIRPGFIVQGGLSDRIDFPQWFGKNSSRTKFKRYLSVLGHHMRAQTSVDRADLRMNYLPCLRKHLVHPLGSGADGAEKVIAMMDQYNLTRDDWDEINELCQLKGQKDPTALLDSKAKAAFTRAYNKGTHVMPYAEEQKLKKKKASASAKSGDADVDGLMDDGDDDEDDVSQFSKKKKASGKAKAKAKGGGGKKKK